MQDLVFGAAGRKCQFLRRESLVNGGLGAMTVSAAAGKVLTGSGPQRVFGFFLTVQKETRPAGRNPLSFPAQIFKKPLSPKEK